jgi:hypothetical protein
MLSSGMLCSVAPVRTDVSEELSASIIRVTRISELGMLAIISNRHKLRRKSIVLYCIYSQHSLVAVTANVVSSSLILVTFMIEALSSSETSVLTRATWRNIPEDGIRHSHRRENLKSYTTYYVFQSAKTIHHQVVYEYMPLLN